MTTSKAIILYVEDDKDSQTLIHRILTHNGYRVLIAPTGLDGLDMARQHHPDLILTDINLPDMSGREITDRLRADPQLGDVPIVAVTAQVHDFERRKTLVAGVNAYLTKPIDLRELVRTVKECLAGQFPTRETEGLEEARQAYHRELIERLENTVRKLEARNRELQRLDRLKDDFIQLTAHELRTPLTTVYGYSRLVQTLPAIQRLMAENTEAHATLTGLLTAIERLHAVVDEIVIVSRIASGKVDLRLAYTNLADIVRQVIVDYTPVLTQRALQLKIQPEAWQVTLVADGQLLEMAFSNLLSNAIKYTPDGGVITLQAQPVHDVEEPFVRITFRDSGIGIAPEDQPYIFDRFYVTGDTQLHSTSKAAFRGGGLGLGLAICKGIIEAHRGRIWVESTGRSETKLPGSTFYIELPLTLQLPK